MKVKVTAALPDGRAVDLVLTADATARVGDLARALARAEPLLLPAHSTSESVTLSTQAPDGSAPRRVEPSVNLTDAGLQSGSTVRLVPTIEPFSQHPTAPRQRPAVRLLVMDGPDLGLEVDLPLGTTTLGRAGDNDVVLSDPSVSQRHAKVVVGTTTEILDRGSANGVRVGDGYVDRAVVGPADIIELGGTALRLERLLAPGVGPALAAPTDFNRSPRVAPVYTGTPTEVPSPPDPARPFRLPFVAMLTPMLMGVAMYSFTRNPMSLVFIVLSPLMMLGGWIDNRRTEKKRVTRETREYADTLASLRGMLDATRAGEEWARRRELPATHDLVSAALGLEPLLWSRRPEHEGFLRLTLGLGRDTARSTVTLPARGKAPTAQWDEAVRLADDFRHVSAVPVVADLRACGALGVAGTRGVVDHVSRALVLQLVTLHSPAEVVLAAVTSSASAGRWSWLRWLPHVSSPHSPVPGPLLASSPPAGSSLVSRVEGLVEARAAQGQSAPALPAVVLVVEDDAPVERGRLVHLAERGPEHGVHVVWVADRQDRLPAVCRAFVRVSPETGVSAGFVAEGREVEPLAPELVDAATASSVARRLSPVTDAGAPTLDESDLPRSVPYLSLAGEEIATSPAAVVERWRENGSLLDRTVPAVRRSGDASLRALVGQGTEQELSLDLRAQGPHALVGGTSGAGKSELLQAWVLGMAAAHSPDRVSFLFVDYKGGAAFADCVDLPHTVGLVTDLSPHLVRRALTSLRAELRRREHLLNRKKAKDLLALERTGDHETPPALVIVVDEFAALVSEVPEFVDGVVDVAQRGRSLGLHLILATQRPAGVIKDNLRANTPLRVALRMADESDSSDVLGDPMAGGFDPAIPGRGVVRTGPGRLAMFQTGYAGGQTAARPARPRVEIETLAFGPGQVWDVPEPDDPDSTGEDDGPTDIARAVSTIATAARAAGVPEPRRPWLPELARRYDLLTLDAGVPGEVPLGVLDDPAHQEQRTVTFRPDEDGNLAVVGTSGSGKSTTLRTVATAAALGAAPEAVQVLALDFGSGGLSMLASLPHVGAVVDGSDAERIDRVLRGLVAELDDRAARYSAARAGTLLEYRALTGATTEPRIYLLVDGLGAFRDAYESTSGRSALFASFSRLLAEGRPLGIHGVVAAERPGAISTALGSSLGRKIVLRQADENAAVAMSVPKDVLGPDSAPGRAVFSGGTDEMQMAVIGGLEKPAEQSLRLDQLAVELRARGVAQAPGVGTLAESYPQSALPDHVDGLPVLGVWSETLLPVPFTPRGMLLVAGMPGSGRSNALHVLAVALRRWSPDLRMYYVGPRRSAVGSLDLWDGTATSVEDVTALARSLLPEMSVPADGDAGVVLVVEGLADHLGSPSEQALTEAIKAARRNDHLVVAEGETTAWGSSWGLVTEVRNGRRGLVLQPDQVDGESIFKTPFPRTARADYPVGRGEFVESGRLRRVQLPLA